MATEIQVVKQQTVKDIIASQLQYLVPAKTERDVILATAYALMQNPDIKRCTPQSIVIAVTNAVDIGFSLSPIDGEVAFIPRANSDTGQVQLIMQPMVRGYVNLARRLGDWEMQAILVYTCDTLKMKKVCEDGFYIDQIDEYQPNLEVQEAHAGNQKWAIDNLRGVICTARRYAKTPKQEIITTPLITKAVIENHRMRSANQKSTTPTGAWLTDYTKMVEKTAYGILARKLPRDSRISHAFSKLDSFEVLDNGMTVDTVTGEIINHAERDDPSVMPDNVAYDSEPDIAPHNAVLDDSAEWREPELPLQRKTSKHVFTEEQYIKGTILACETSDEVVEFWETVPPDIKPKFQDAFDKKLDLFR